VSLPGERYQFVGRGKGPGGPNQKPADELTTFSRKDDTWSTEPAITWYISPVFQADLSCLYRDVDSDADFESFQEVGGSVGLGWFPADSINLFMSGFWSRLDFEKTPELLERRDEFYGFSFRGGRSVGKMEFFIQYDRTINDSPVIGEDFKKSVLQCGAGYTF
jgi:hypothetical protein